jgi:hypothetical protein
MSVRRRLALLLARLVSPQLWQPLAEYAKEQLRRGKSEWHVQALLMVEELEQRDLATDLNNVRTAYTLVSIAWFIFGSSGVLCCLAVALVLVADMQMSPDDAEASRASSTSASSERSSGSSGQRRRSVVGVALDAVSLALEPLEQAESQLEAPGASPAAVKRSKSMWPFLILSPKSKKRQERAAASASAAPPQLSPLQKTLKSVGSLGEMFKRSNKKRTAAA